MVVHMKCSTDCVSYQFDARGCVCPLLLAELTPEHIRGVVICLSEIVLNVGIVLEFISGFCLMFDQINRFLFNVRPNKLI